MFVEGWGFYLRIIKNIHNLLWNSFSSTQTRDESINSVLHVSIIFKSNVHNECYFKTLFGLDLNWLSSNFGR